MNSVYYPNIDTDPLTITPLYNWMLVRRLREPEGPIMPSGKIMGAGGQWLKAPDLGPRKGVVIVTGRGDKIAGTEEREAMEVRPGDVILYARFESTHLQIRWQEYTFVREADVMGIYEAWHCGGCGIETKAPEPDEVVTCPECGTVGCVNRARIVLDGEVRLAA